MSVLVYTENWDGKFKKLSFELVSYGAALARMLNTEVVALSIGNVQTEALQSLAKFGASKIISVNENRFATLDNKAFSEIISQTAAKEQAVVIILAHNNYGKALAPRLSVKLKAGLVSGVTALPTSTEPFAITKKAFTGKAQANIVVKTAVKILTLSQNAFGIAELPVTGTIEPFCPAIDDSSIKTKVTDVSKVTGQVLLTDAEIVVSGGRGMKGPENWGPIEELAHLLGAATACSRPVSDEGWRSHHEHVGQTGKMIAPNLYFACGISGAIQHLGGISSSKCIVAINKDPEAPIFEAADYGVVGDVQKVLPELIAAFKELKGN
jgi:electron transfer flavoprotein alpha subunit